MENILRIAPYIAWMALMMLGLPYWVRVVVSGALLVALVARSFRSAKVNSGSVELVGSLGLVGSLAWGVLAGVIVLGVWILPETINPPVSNLQPQASNLELVIQLLGSAFIISAAEELFFRDWLYKWLLERWSKWAAVGIMLALFAVEHDKWACAIFAGAVYFLLYLKRGLGSAIIAHATTNLLLGLYVIFANKWYYW